MRIVTAGDNCIDVYKSLNKYYPGGNPVNVAVYLAKLGVEAAYVGVVGDDEYGRIMRDAIHQQGVDISHLHRITGQTAVTEVELVEHDRVFGDYFEGVLENFTLSEEDMAFIGEFPLLHTGIWGKLEGDLQKIRQQGLTVSFDFADKLDHEIVTKALPYVDYAFFSHDTADDFIKEYLIHAWRSGPKLAVATLGINGSLAYDGIRFHTQAAIPVEVVDTMGAGDAFIAGFLHSAQLQKDLDGCMEAGSRNASRIIRHFGAW
jgi:fructoselysine 6-kinase